MNISEGRAWTWKSDRPEFKIHHFTSLELPYLEEGDGFKSRVVKLSDKISESDKCLQILNKWSINILILFLIRKIPDQ
jgi:hypothetical protein